jgi:hypothetical protein
MTGTARRSDTAGAAARTESAARFAATPLLFISVALHGGHDILGDMITDVGNER